MKLLLKAALRVKHHFVLFLISLLTLLGLTVANQAEMLTFGVLSDVGADFFSLFAAKDARGEQKEYVTFEDIQEQWDKIDRKNEGIITYGDAQDFIVKKFPKNQLKRIMHQIKMKLHLEHGVTLFILFLCAVAINRAIFLFFSRYTTQKLSICICRDLRQQYFDQLQLQSMEFFRRYSVGRLSSCISNDSDQIASAINSLTTNYIHTPFIIISTLTICFYASWQLSLLLFLGFPMIVLPIIFVTRRVKRVTRHLQKNQEALSSILLDFLSGIQTIKIFAMELFSRKRYREQNNQMANLEVKTAKYDLLMRPILHTVTTFCLSSTLIVGLHVMEMKISELIVFVGLFYLLYEPIKKFAEQNTNIQKGVVAAERMFSVINLRPHIVDHPLAVDLQGFKKSLEFKNVWFRYEQNWILQDLSFAVNKGETVALVGETGVGKSTIVHLLPRLHDIQKGKILIDNIPIQKYTQKSLREHISFVPQQPFLFYDTVAANIAYGKPFSREEIIQAAKKAHAHEFISQLPQGYDTRLMEIEKIFSGGQQQRLVIARALIKNAPILILDEATSSLDAISEHNIKMTIKELHGEMTQILIAHRLSTIEHADRIIYLQKGRKLAEGTQEELFSHCSPFRLLWETYFQSQKEKTSAPN